MGGTVWCWSGEREQPEPVLIAGDDEKLQRDALVRAERGWWCALLRREQQDETEKELVRPCEIGVYVRV